MLAVSKIIKIAFPLFLGGRSGHEMLDAPYKIFEWQSTAISRFSLSFSLHFPGVFEEYVLDGCRGVSNEF